MTDRTGIGPWIRRFLLEHLVAERNLARNTQASYRDTLTLLLPFLSAATTTPIDRLAIEDLSPSRLRGFLEHLETERGCRVGTRNQRLGAIHSLAKFVGLRSPEHLAWCGRTRTGGFKVNRRTAATRLRRAITRVTAWCRAFKKTATPVMAYLDKPEMDALLTVHRGRTAQGARNHAVLLFLYNTGARVDEAVHVTVADLTLGSSPSVRLLGKGRKARSCPLWPVTAETLTRLVLGHAPHDAVFRNRQGRPLTRFGIYRLVQHTVTRARASTPSLATKRVSPHTLRHTCAVHLLRAGVDINTIRAWLGHVSLNTTHVYAEIDLDMKAKALARCDLPEADTVTRWRTDPNLMSFLKAL